jgi:hypothetical protein
LAQSVYEGAKTKVAAICVYCEISGADGILATIYFNGLKNGGDLSVVKAFRLR